VERDKAVAQYEEACIQLERDVHLQVRLRDLVEHHEAQSHTLDIKCRALEEEVTVLEGRLNEDTRGLHSHIAFEQQRSRREQDEHEAECRDHEATVQQLVSARERIAVLERTRASEREQWELESGAQGEVMEALKERQREDLALNEDKVRQMRYGHTDESASASLRHKREMAEMESKMERQEKMREALVRDLAVVRHTQEASLAQVTQLQRHMETLVAESERKVETLRHKHEEELRVRNVAHESTAATLLSKMSKAQEETRRATAEQVKATALKGAAEEHRREGIVRLKELEGSERALLAEVQDWRGRGEKTERATQEAQAQVATLVKEVRNLEEAGRSRALTEQKEALERTHTSALEEARCTHTALEKQLVDAKLRQERSGLEATQQQASIKAQEKTKKHVLNEQRKELARVREQFQSELDLLTGKLAKTASTLEMERKKNLTSEERLISTRAIRVELEGKLEEAMVEAEGTRERSIEANDEKESLLLELESESKQLTASQGECRKMGELVQELQSRLVSLNKDILGLKEELVGANEAHVQAFVQQQADFEETSTALRLERDEGRTHSEQQLKDLTHQNSDLQQALASNEAAKRGSAERNLKRKVLAHPRRSMFTLSRLLHGAPQMLCTDANFREQGDVLDAFWARICTNAFHAMLARFGDKSRIVCVVLVRDRSETGKVAPAGGGRSFPWSKIALRLVSVEGHDVTQGRGRREDQTPPSSVNLNLAQHCASEGRLVHRAAGQVAPLTNRHGIPEHSPHEYHNNIVCVPLGSPGKLPLAVLQCVLLASSSNDAPKRRAGNAPQHEVDSSGSDRYEPSSDCSSSDVGEAGESDGSAGREKLQDSNAGKRSKQQNQRLLYIPGEASSSQQVRKRGAGGTDEREMTLLVRDHLQPMGRMLGALFSCHAERCMEVARLDTLVERNMLEAERNMVEAERRIQVARLDTLAEQNMLTFYAEISKQLSSLSAGLLSPVGLFAVVADCLPAVFPVQTPSSSAATARLYFWRPQTSEAPAHLFTMDKRALIHPTATVVGDEVHMPAASPDLPSYLLQTKQKGLHLDVANQATPRLWGQYAQANVTGVLCLPLLSRELDELGVLEVLFCSKPAEGKVVVDARALAVLAQAAIPIVQYLCFMRARADIFTQLQAVTAERETSLQHAEQLVQKLQETRMGMEAQLEEALSQAQWQLEQAQTSHGSEMEEQVTAQKEVREALAVCSRGHRELVGEFCKQTTQLETVTGDRITAENGLKEATALVDELRAGLKGKEAALVEAQELMLAKQNEYLNEMNCAMESTAAAGQESSDSIEELKKMLRAAEADKSALHAKLRSAVEAGKEYLEEAEQRAKAMVENVKSSASRRVELVNVENEVLRLRVGEQQGQLDMQSQILRREHVLLGTRSKLLPHIGIPIKFSTGSISSSNKSTPTTITTSTSATPITNPRDSQNSQPDVNLIATSESLVPRGILKTMTSNKIPADNTGSATPGSLDVNGNIGESLQHGRPRHVHHVHRQRKDTGPYLDDFPFVASLAFTDVPPLPR
jgi:hypothetical protein